MLGQASRSIELTNIRPIELSAKVMVDEDGLSSPALDASLEVQRNDEDFTVVGEFSFVAANEAASTSVEIKYRVLASYRIREGVSLSKHAVQLFAMTSSMVHLWPYFRSYVQSSCATLQVPPFVIPPFRPGAVEFRSPDGADADAGPDEA